MAHFGRICQVKTAFSVYGCLVPPRFATASNGFTLCETSKKSRAGGAAFAAFRARLGLQEAAAVAENSLVVAGNRAFAARLLTKSVRWMPAQDAAMRWRLRRTPGPEVRRQTDVDLEVAATAGPYQSSRASLRLRSAVDRKI